MKIMKINLNCGANNEIIAQLNFKQIPVYIYENTRYLLDDLYDGYCQLPLQNEKTYDLFAKHNVQKITQKSNPNLMRELINLFVKNDYMNNGHLVKREIKVNISDDENIQELFEDEDFKHLNEEISKNKDVVEESNVEKDIQN